MALFGGKISGGSRASALQSTGNVNAVRGIQGNAGKGSAGMDLRNMSKGQTFEGTVVAVKGKSVTIESEGHYLNARMEDSVSISIGEKISFLIRANKDNRIEIAPLRMGNIPMEELVQYKALESAGLKATEKNMEIVKGLMKYRMAVNKDSIFHILGYLMKYPDLQVEDILLMKKIRNHVKNVTLYQYRENSCNKRIKNFILELETKYLGSITVYIQWEETKRSIKQDSLYLLFQIENEHIKEFLQKQENQWKERLQERNIICKAEYISMENGQENYQKAAGVAEKFFGKLSEKANCKEDIKGKLYIQKFSLD